MIEQLAKVERLIENDWHVCRMSELNKGDIFRMTEHTGEYRGDCNWVASSEPRMTKYDGDDVWGIDANPEGKDDDNEENNEENA